MRSGIEAAIVGAGLVTGLGCDGRSTLAAMRRGERLSNRGEISADMLRDAMGLAALPPEASGVKSSYFDEAVPTHSPDRSILLAFAAAGQAIRESGWTTEDLQASDTDIFAATSKGPVLNLLAVCDQARSPNPAEMTREQAMEIALGPAAMGAALAGAFQIGGSNATSVGACAGGLLAFHAAVQHIRHGLCRRALVVASDASIHPLFESAFANLGVLALSKKTLRAMSGGLPAEATFCEPFDDAGRGFFISEAGAAIAIEAVERGQLDRRDGARLNEAALFATATWSGADGTTLLALDPAGKALWRGLRACCERQGARIAWVHAHAAGTRHDLAERAAIQSVCGVDIVHFSHKRYLGHALGASGLVGLVISREVHRDGRAPDGRAVPPGPSLTVAQGFGGHIAIAALGSPSR